MLSGKPGRAEEILAGASDETPALQLLRAELAWTQNEEAAGRELLRNLLGDPDAGYRAAWLLSLYYLDRREPEAVQEVLEKQPDFAQSVAGQEMLARARLLEGREVDALAIYRELGDESDEARIYLARQAFVTRDWATAEALSRSLLDDYPNEPAFSQNLEKIAEARDTP